MRLKPVDWMEQLSDKGLAFGLELWGRPGGAHGDLSVACGWLWVQLGADGRLCQAKRTAKPAAVPFIPPFKTAILGQTDGKTGGSAVQIAGQTAGNIDVLGHIAG